LRYSRDKKYRYLVTKFTSADVVMLIIKAKNLNTEECKVVAIVSCNYCIFFVGRFGNKEIFVNLII